MSLNVEVTKTSPLWRALPGVDGLARRALGVSLLASGAGVLDGAEVSIRLADDAQVRALNARWRGIDKPTNVLSFPAVAAEKIAGAPLLGDIVLAFETAQREAAGENKALADHVVHLTVHGFLHLLGFDHQIADEADRMEALEASILAELGIENPYALTIPVDANA
jgi:probable rRNA maturation factor